MDWFVQLFIGHGVAQSIVALCLVMVLGQALGHIRLRGISLGVGGVLFSGIFLAHIGLKVDAEILHFVREAGLIFFVFTVGMQVGPGFVDSLRRRGLALNIAAAIIVVLGVATALLAFYLFDLPIPVMAGILSGAVTNTPSLAAVSEVFAEIYPETVDIISAQAQASKAYAIAYPFGILGIIFAMLLIKHIFRIVPEKELAELKEREAKEHPAPKGMTLIVSNPGVIGLSIEEMLELGPGGVVISRTRESPSESIRAASQKTILKKDMQVHAVGTAEQLAKLRILVGANSEQSLPQQKGRVETRRLLVTRSTVAGKSVRDIALTPGQGVTVTRIVRSGVEFTADYGVHLHYGDTVVCVGEADALERAANVLGDSAKELEHPHLLPIFLGILLGVVVGSIPFPVPGLPSGLKLGLAGGPLVVAIFLSRVNNFAGMVWYLPLGGNLAFRETGIALFLACVGLSAGDGFIDTLLSATGASWIIIGACITFLPLFLVAMAMRSKIQSDYASICGLLSGAMTDPPALAFAVQTVKSDMPSSVYAGVYPLSMLLRIFTAQIAVLACRLLG